MVVIGTNRNLKSFTWTPLSTLRNEEDRAKICSPDTVPRLAREEIYVADIQNKWNEDFDPTKVQSRRMIDSLGTPFPYKSSTTGIEYMGYLVVPSDINLETKEKLPVVVIFHTGAGPQDVFNRYQADKIARETVWGEKGCIVLVADLLSDSIGWTWGDRDRYWKARKDLFEVIERDNVKRRWRLRDALSAMIDALGQIKEAGLIIAFGFCMGGQPAIELARMKPKNLKGIITFHGLFDGVELPEMESQSQKLGKTLICHGVKDPWVPIDDVEKAVDTFNWCGYETKLLKFENAQHNFSNPRTHYDDSKGFGYDEEASSKSWQEAMILIKAVLALEENKGKV